MDLSPADGGGSRLSLKSFWGLFLICGIACFLALIFFFCRVCGQFRRFGSEDEESIETEEIGHDTSTSGRRPLRSTSFKDLIDFIDRKEAEIKEILKRKNSDNKRPSQSSDG